MPEESKKKQLKCTLILKHKHIMALKANRKMPVFSIPLN